MLDIILFAILAFVIGMRLFNTFGEKRQNTQELKINLRNSNKTVQTKHVEKILNKQISSAERLELLDKAFDQRAFIKNSESAVKVVLDAYAEGNTEILSDLLEMKMLRAFAYNISLIEDKELIAHISIIKITPPSISKIEIHKTEATISINTELELIGYLQKDKKVIFGYKNKVEKNKIGVKFTRNIKSSDPTWKIIDISYIPFTKFLVKNG